MTIDIRETMQALFPAGAAALRALERESPRFGELAARYDVLCRQIYRIEIDAEPATQARLAALRSERCALLTDVAGLIAAQVEHA
jgi:uncharacterized protein YdcH (DUF465 family)